MEQKKRFKTIQAVIVARLISSVAAHSQTEGSTSTELVQISKCLTFDLDNLLNCLLNRFQREKKLL